MKKILDIIEGLLKIFCQLFISAIVVVIFYAVVMRYIFKLPPAWSEELSRFIFIWMIMFGAALASREKSHIQVTFLVDLLPRALRSFFSILVDLFMIGFCFVMIQQGLKIYPTVAEASSPSFGISMGWLYLSIPVSGCLMIIFILEPLIRSFLAANMGASEEKTSAEEEPALGEKPAC